MIEYKELVAELKELAEEEKEFASNSGDIYCAEKLALAADAIEQLVKERDAAVADLYELFTKDESPCAFCVAEHCDKCIKPDRIDYPYWEWRGVQEEENGTEI